MKKTFLLSVSLPLLLSFFIVSCQKEMSFENAGKAGGTAKYSFDGGTGSCTGAVLAGTFTAGTPVTSANTVTLSVTVDSIGTYIVSTNTVNGISFSGTGVFTSTGVQDITLTADGTPTVAGGFNFAPVENGCTFLVPVVASSGGSSGTATYTFTGGTSSCTDATVNGTFTAGTATSSANTVVLKINVDKEGSYTISTNSVNGITFVGTGNFTAKGAQTVTLTASGTPTAAGNFAFKPGTNGCSFNVTVVGSGGGNPGGSGNFLRCKINGVLTNFNVSLAGLYTTPPPGTTGIPYSVGVHGINSSVANSKEELWVGVSNATPPGTGLYTNLTFSSGPTDRGGGMSIHPDGFGSTTSLFWGTSVFNTNTASVNITSITTGSAVAGTFQGTIYENNGIGPATKQITEGEFKVTY